MMRVYGRQCLPKDFSQHDYVMLLVKVKLDKERRHNSGGTGGGM